MKKMFIAILVLSLPYMGYAQEETGTSLEITTETTASPQGSEEENLSTQKKEESQDANHRGQVVRRETLSEIPSRCGYREPLPNLDVLDNELPDQMLLRWPRQGVKMNRQYLRNTPRY